MTKAYKKQTYNFLCNSTNYTKPYKKQTTPLNDKALQETNKPLLNDKALQETNLQLFMQPPLPQNDKTLQETNL